MAIRSYVDRKEATLHLGQKFLHVLQIRAVMVSAQSLLRAGLSFDLRFVSKLAEPFVPIGNDLGESPIGLFLLI